MANLKVRNLSGRKTFDFILGQFVNCYSDLKIFFKEEGPEEKNVIVKYLPELEKIQQFRNEIDINNWIRIDLAYTIVFMGLSRPGQKAVRDVFKDKLNDNFLLSILNFLSKKPHRDSDFYKNWENLCKEDFIKGAILKDCSHIEKINNTDFLVLKEDEGRYFKYYGGHQYKLSHYYRHLYQTVKYINSSDILTYDAKYNYISFLRAQLSTPEQMLFAINAISSLGREWEFKGVLNKNTNESLVTKYNLIKNIVDLTIDNTIDVKSFFPDVTFQFEECSKNRKNLERHFK